MKIQQLGENEIAGRLAGAGLRFRTGPFVVELRTDPNLRLATALSLLYGDVPLEEAGGIADFHIRLRRPISLRRWARPQVVFERDGKCPFMPFPADHAIPLFEWGLNWCVSTRCHQYLLLHAAALERHGKTLLFPAWPGSGKSTLAGAMMHRGWRLLSDEFGVVRPGTGEVIPFPRPIPLKNESIEIIQCYAAEAVLGPIFPKTRKGTVAHLVPTLESVDYAGESVKPTAVVFPAYERGARARVQPVSKARAFMKLASNSFNYELLGESAFDTIADLVARCPAAQLRYQDLDEAINTIERLIS